MSYGYITRGVTIYVMNRGPNVSASSFVFIWCYTGNGIVSIRFYGIFLFLPIDRVPFSLCNSRTFL